jgi:pyruvate,water dikinase
VIDPVPLALVEEESRFGGKALSLARSLRAGLPVPPGFALDVDAVDAIAADVAGGDVFARMLNDVGGRAAVRSSAVGEDAKDASFAGQHLTVLNAASVQALVHAVRAVRQSAHSSSALAYRERMGVSGPPRIGVVVQHLVQADAAGVLFTRHPATGARERLIEAAWGLGESVVSGAVVPDAYRLAPDGRLLERAIGEKDLALCISADGGTAEVAVESSRVHAPVLNDAELAELHGLALRCEEVFGHDLDIEWAIESGTLYLLQCRSITRTAS